MVDGSPTLFTRPEPADREKENIITTKLPLFIGAVIKTE